MSKKTAPLFRGSVKGYKKEDVNSYLLKLNGTMEEKEADYKKTLDEYKAKAEQDREYISDLEDLIKKQGLLISELNEKLSSAEEKLESKENEDQTATAEADALRARVAELESALSSFDDKSREADEKAQYYESVCSKAGEILFIASGTAENILSKANDEAQRIVGSANTKKELMFKTLSQSYDAAASDINTYIKACVEDCIKKIDKSIKEVCDLPEVPKKERPKATFINGN